MSFSTINSPIVPISNDQFLQFWYDSLFEIFSDQDNIFETFNADFIQRLLKKGANVNECENNYEMNFLQKCILEEFSLHDTEGAIFKEVIQVLINAKIDLNHQDVDGCTALHLAIEKNQFDLAKLLLEKGVLSTTCDCDGKTAFDYAMSYDPDLMPESIKKQWEELIAMIGFR